MLFSKFIKLNALNTAHVLVFKSVLYPSDDEVDLDRHYAVLVELVWPSKHTWLPAQETGFSWMSLQTDAPLDNYRLKVVTVATCHQMSHDASSTLFL